MCGRKKTDADDIDVLLHGGVHGGLAGLPQPGVDHLDPRVAEGPCQNLDAAIVAVEADLGEKDAGMTLS